MDRSGVLTQQPRYAGAGYQSPLEDRLPPTKGVARTTKKAIDYQSQRRFNGDDYRSKIVNNHQDLANEVSDVKRTVYTRIDRVNKSKELPTRRKTSRSRKHSSRSSSSSSSSSSSEEKHHHKRTKKSKRSRSIVHRLKGDLEEVENLQHIKYQTVLKDRDCLEATNREFASIVKDLKRQLEDTQNRYHDLETQYKLLEAASARGAGEQERQRLLSKRFESEIKDLRDMLAMEKAGAADKKQRWRQKNEQLQAELDKLKEQNGTLQGQVSDLQQLSVNQDNLITEEKEKQQNLEEKLEDLKRQLDDARKELAAANEKNAGQDTELAEVSVRLQYETKNGLDLKKEIDRLRAELADKDLKMEEFKKEARKKRDKLLAGKDAEIARLQQENNDLKSNLAKAEARIADLESMIEELKDKLEDTLRQLNIAEIKLGDLVREKELVLELKTNMNDRDREIDQKRDYTIVIYFLQ